jgi:hypothetical protein
MNMSTKKEHVISSELTDALGEIAMPRATKAASVKGKPERDKVSSTFYIPRATHKWLKQTAMDRNTSLQQLLEEAVDEWLARNNGPAFNAE